MYRFVTLIAFLVGLVIVDGGISAQDRRAGVDPIKIVPLDASAFVQVRVKRFFESPVGKMFVQKVPQEMVKMSGEANKWYGLKVFDIESMTYVWTKLDPAKAAGEPVVIVVTREPYDRDKVSNAITATANQVTTKDGKKPEKSAKDLAGLSEKDFVQGHNWCAYFIGPDTFVAGENAKQIAALVELINRKSKRGALEPAVRVALPEHSLVAGAGGPNGLPWNWPKQLESLQPLGAATSIGVGLLVKDDVRMRVFADFPPGTVADGREAATQLPILGKMFANPPPQVSYLRFVAPLLQNVAMEVEGSTLRIGSGVPPPVIASMIESMGAGPKKAEDQKQIRAIAVAMQNYHDEKNQKFPAHAIYSKDGKPLLSWRVELLPKLGQKALYDKFKRNEPWDSEHNKALISQMPAAYSTGGLPRDKGQTHYQIFVGDKAAWPKSKESFGQKKITDGTSNTLMIVQAAEPVTWTKPDDLEFDPDKPLPKLGIGGKPPLVALFDVSVRELPANWPEKNWKAAITPSGGEVIDWPK